MKLLFLQRIFLEQTDEQHPLTLSQLQQLLASNDIAAERKSLYDDIDTLRRFGLDVIAERKGEKTVYFVASRDFELAELKLLVDSVQCSKFITEKKSMRLIQKIGSLTSRWEAQALRRQVYMFHRVKTVNESIYYSVDKIHSAIAKNRKIRFQYFEYTIDKLQRLRRGGKYYLISPFALTWDDENYYLIGYESESNLVKHYRVDKMLHISETDMPRDGLDVFESIDIAVYTGKFFSMFSGAEQTVSLQMDNGLIGAVIDRFGKDILIFPFGEESFSFTVKVAVSGQFFAWVFQFGTKAKILSPPGVVSSARELLDSLHTMYNAKPNEATDVND
jgi:predicted DNA-binding transcriptional regulator YafY